MNHIEQKLKDLELTLPALTSSKGIYKRCLSVGNLVYVSGHVSVVTGKLGRELDEEEGAFAARQCGLAMLAALKNHLGDLDRIKRVVKLLGMVNSVEDYEKHPLVINGCSALFAQLWGDENGIGVRSAVGMGSLPGNVAVEIEGIFELV